MVGYSLKCLTHPSHLTMGSTAHFFCLLFPSQHSQAISAEAVLLLFSSPLKKTPADQKKQRLQKVQKRPILQSSNFKEMVAQMKYRGLQPFQSLQRAPLDPKGWVVSPWDGNLSAASSRLCCSASSGRISPLFVGDLELQHSANRSSLLEEARGSILATMQPKAVLLAQETALFSFSLTESQQKKQRSACNYSRLQFSLRKLPLVLRVGLHHGV